ncbi:MAG: DUF4234 domain-containing protein [Oscillospiraceae bacterium]|nr:DUF4234 domain-containing protein [Oscillospiraceae bacterium]
MPIQQRNLLTLILLSFITCGIYAIWFWYKFSEDMNRVCEGDGDTTMNYVLAFLLSIVTCGFFTFYWFYGVGNRLSHNAPRYGLNMPENGTSVLMWMIFGSLLCGLGSFIAWHILIRNMNSVAERYNNR